MTVYFYDDQQVVLSVYIYSQLFEFVVMDIFIGTYCSVWTLL